MKTKLHSGNDRLMERPEQILRECFDLWASGPDGVLEAWRRHAADDIVWSNSARGKIEGLQTCIAAIKAMYEALGVDHTKVPIRTLVVDGNRAFVERSDDLYAPDGSLIQSVPVVGVVEFTGDKIVEWRDYCNDWMLKLGESEAARGDQKV